IGESEGPLIDPKHFIRCCCDPVQQGWLLKVAHVVEVWDQIIPLFYHLAGDFSISTLIRLLQRIAIEVVEKEKV
ncbi:MAG: hypothetical protein GYA68_09070, partial [Syntrophorhabdus sp.]|nr:hypothetical protein [Syntrophorhabdus sp.]